MSRARTPSHWPGVPIVSSSGVERRTGAARQRIPPSKGVAAGPLVEYRSNPGFKALAPLAVTK
ncbi:MAG: hypothetical protein ABI054_08305 [Planctomycetota bacterium]